MELIHLLVLGNAVVAGCIFVQSNRMLNAEARKQAAKRQVRDAQRQALGLGK